MSTQGGARVKSEAVVRVLQAQGDLDTLSAEDLQTGQRIDYLNGNTEQLIALVDELQRTITVPYRLRAMSSKWDTRNGKRPLHEQAFSWVLVPEQSTPQAPPAQAPATPTPVQSARVPEGYVSEEHARLKTEHALNEARMQRLEERINELLDAPVEADAPLRWWETEKGMELVADTIKPIGQAMGELLRSLKKRPEIVKGTQEKGRPEEDAPPPDIELPEDTEERDRLLLQAWHTFRTLSPNEAADYERHLVAGFRQANESAKD